MNTLHPRAPYSLLVQLGRLFNPEPDPPSPHDPRFLPADIPEMTPDQLMEVRYGRGRTGRSERP